MLDDVIEALDRRYQGLVRRQRLRDFLLHMIAFFNANDREPRLRIHLDDMASDAQRAYERFCEEDRGLIVTSRLAPSEAVTSSC